MENMYGICTDYLGIISGTNNRTSSVYIEAAKTIGEDSLKGMGYLKNFIISIENIAKKDGVKDPQISASKGNIKSYNGYDNIHTAMEFLKKNLGDVKILKDIIALYDALEKFQPQYTDGYNKNCRLVILEYESVVYMLITGLSMIMANNIDFVQTGIKIQIKKKNSNTHGTINDVISKLAKELNAKNHKEYLEVLNKAVDEKHIDTEIKESTYMESVVTDTIEIVKAAFSIVPKLFKFGVATISAIKNSLFGIIPLIRSILYLKYKRKADKVLALDQQVQFIEKNIERLEAKESNMSPEKKAEIIKKQQAVIEAYKKRAEKLRAELMEEEKEASIAIKKEDSQMKNTDDDFIIEGVKIKDIFDDFSEAISINKLSPEVQDALKKAIKDRIKDTNRPIKTVSINDIESFFNNSINENTIISNKDKKMLHEIIKSKTPILLDELDDLSDPSVSLDDNNDNSKDSNNKKKIEPIKILLIDESSDDINKIKNDIKTAENLLKNAADHELSEDEKKELLDSMEKLHPTAKKLISDAINKNKRGDDK